MFSAGNPSGRAGRAGLPGLQPPVPTAMLPEMTWPGGQPVPGSRRLAQHATQLLQLAGVGLGAFHAWLFGAHLVDGRLADPMVALRWVVGLALFGGLLWLRRLGVPILRGRRAAGLWTLVFLLHCHAVAVPGSEAASQFSLPAVAEAVVLGVGTALGLGLLLVLAHAAPVRRRAFAPVWHHTPCPASGSVSAGHLLALAPRPPPA